MNYTLDQELKRSAEMVVELSSDLGVYFAVALLYDSAYDLDRMRKLLPFLQSEPGSITGNHRKTRRYED